MHDTATCRTYIAAHIDTDHGDVYVGHCLRHGWESDPATSFTVAQCRVTAHEEEQGEA